MRSAAAPAVPLPAPHGTTGAATTGLRFGLLRRPDSRARPVGRSGTAAIDLGWVAHGKLDASIILANLPWDTMAGVLLVREAGGVVLDRDGTEHTTDSS